MGVLFRFVWLEIDRFHWFRLIPLTKTHLFARRTCCTWAEGVPFGGEGWNQMALPMGSLWMVPRPSGGLVVLKIRKQVFDKHMKRPPHSMRGVVFGRCDWGGVSSWGRYGVTTCFEAEGGDRAFVSEIGDLTAWGTPCLDWWIEGK